MHPKVYIGPNAIDEVVTAAEAAGAKIVTDIAEAEAVVWIGPASEFATLDHDGIRWVQTSSAGVESWFAANAFSPGKVFTSAAGSYAESCAEHALALLLAGTRHLAYLAHQHSWTSVRSASLYDQTIGIVGAGGIGRALIDLLAPFRVRIHAVNRSGTPVPGAATTVTPDRLDDVLTASDHIVIAAPATAATRHLIGPRELGLMHDHTWLVNVARGSLVDTDALVEALRSGAIAGAALDVTDPEPLPDGHPLWSEPRALITPHSANPEHLLLPRLAERVGENVRRYIAGEDLLGRIDTDRGY